MRRSVLLAALAAAVLLPAAPALAHPTVPLDPTLPFDVTFASTDNVEHLGRFPEHAGTAGGRLSDDGTRFYLTDPRGVYIYDTTTPAHPVLLGSVPLFQTTTGAALAQEDVDTNGRILLVDAATTPAAASSRLQIVDVSDARAPKVLSSVAVTDHTWTCVSSGRGSKLNTCAFAYGRTGHIVDLRNPATPVLLDQTWRAAVDYGNRGNSPYTHDLTEIRPGLVMTAGVSSVVMDTTDPTAPVRLTEIGARNRFSSLGYHSVEWARGGRDRFVVFGTEIGPPPLPGLPAATENTAGSDCDGPNSVIETWDASAFHTAMKTFEATGDSGAFTGELFTLVDSYDASGRGLFLTGEAPGSQLYCAHWMDLNPRFKNGGLMAIAYYNRGTRFVEVGSDGMMTEVGWITPAEGYTGSPRWITDEITYVMDYRRGLEVVRLAPTPAKKVVRSDNDSIATASAFELPGGPFTGTHLAYGAMGLLALGLLRIARVGHRRQGGLTAATA